MLVEERQHDLVEALRVFKVRQVAAPVEDVKLGVGHPFHPVLGGLQRYADVVAAR